MQVADVAVVARFVRWLFGWTVTLLIRGRTDERI